MMYRKITKSVILIGTILLLIESIYDFVSADKTSYILAIFIFFKLLLCWLAYKSMKGKRWSMILLAFFFLLGSFNIRTESFTFINSPFFDFEIKINSLLSLNFLISLFVVGLITETILVSIEKRKTKTIK